MGAKESRPPKPPGLVARSAIQGTDLNVGSTADRLRRPECELSHQARRLRARGDPEDTGLWGRGSRLRGAAGTISKSRRQPDRLAVPPLEMKEGWAVLGSSVDWTT